MVEKMFMCIFFLLYYFVYVYDMVQYIKMIG